MMKHLWNRSKQHDDERSAKGLEIDKWFANYLELKSFGADNKDWGC